jgi:hypothetical protein
MARYRFQLIFQNFDIGGPGLLRTLIWVGALAALLV